jgi:hypothetical protein
MHCWPGFVGFAIFSRPSGEYQKSFDGEIIPFEV